jgi:hypothetical protein
MPTSELHTDTYVAEVKARFASLPSVKMTVIQGQQLKEQGFGGLWGVGKVFDALHMFHDNMMKNVYYTFLFFMLTTCLYFIIDYFFSHALYITMEWTRF